MSYLFNDKLLDIHEREVVAQLAENAKKNESPEVRSERNILLSRLEWLQKLRAFHDLVDKGETRPLLRGNEMVVYHRVLSVTDIFSLTGDATPYLDMARLMEVSLIPTHGAFRNEHALLTVYSATHGVVAVEEGMRYVTHEVLAVKTASTSEGLFKLATILIPSYQVRLHDFTIRSIPVSKPKGVEYEELRRNIKNWLHAFIPISDGFIQWDNPSCIRIMELMRPEWWKQI